MAATAPPTPDPNADKPPRRRRWIPLSLRMFLAVLVFVGVPGVLSVGVPACRQYIVLNQIERAGGEFSARPRGPEWLRERFSTEFGKFFDEVYAVKLSGNQVTDAELVRLKAFPALDMLILSDTQVTGSGFLALRCTPHLEDLRLVDSPITDGGLKQIGKAVRITHLQISSAQVTNAGLAHLQPLDALEKLTILCPQVTDDGLIHLYEIRNLKVVCVWKTQVTDAGVAELRMNRPGLLVRK